MAIKKIIEGRANIETLAAVAVSDWIELESRFNPFECSVSLSRGAAAVLEASVEYTLDPDPDTAPANEIRNVQFVDEADTTRTKIDATVEYLDAPFEWPLGFVRLNVTAHTSGTAKMTLLQPGRP